MKQKNGLLVVSNKSCVSRLHSISILRWSGSKTKFSIHFFIQNLLWNKEKYFELLVASSKSCAPQSIFSPVVQNFRTFFNQNLLWNKKNGLLVVSNKSCVSRLHSISILRWSGSKTKFFYHIFSFRTWLEQKKYFKLLALLTKSKMPHYNLIAILA